MLTRTHSKALGSIQAIVAPEPATPTHLDTHVLWSELGSEIMPH